MQDTIRPPTILIPYPGPSLAADNQDVAIYLRPESNGVKVESTLLRFIHGSPEYRRSLGMVYLANLPGEMVDRRRIIENHYALRLHFARCGARAFTPTMIRGFEHFFGVRFAGARVLGAFEAMEVLGLTAEQLFQVWVPADQVIRLHDQTVKRYRGLYIVNYDIPALLARSCRDKDIFSMILRSTLPYSRLHDIVAQVVRALEQEDILPHPGIYTHVFHYSKGPFEQVLDAISYVCGPGGEPLEPRRLSFVAYLLAEGCREEDILEAIRRPIRFFHTPYGVQEHNLLVYTAGDTFPEAARKFRARLDV